MKFYIMTDLEGPAGVNRWAQTRDGDSPLKRQAMEWLTEEVNAAVEGILETDPAAEIVVLDGHGDGGILFELLHPRAECILYGSGLEAPYGLDRSFHAVFFVGQHAMAGTANAPLCHTYSSRTVEYYRLNGEFVGEIGCFAAMAGSLGVPAVFLSGDDKACDEASALIPQLVTVSTKTGMGIQLARHLSLQEARVRIRVGAAAAAASSIPPYVIQPPYELEIRVQEGQPVDGYVRRGASVIDHRTVLLRAQEIADLMN